MIFGIIAGLIMLYLLVIGGCQVEQSVSYGGLQIEDSMLARYEGGEWHPVDDAVFNKGDEIGLILLNVGKFSRGEDGLNWLDIDVELKDPSGKVILSEEGILGSSGKADLKDDIAPKPVGSVNTIDDMETGKYTIKVTVHDKVSGNKASTSRTFMIE